MAPLFLPLLQQLWQELLLSVTLFNSFLISLVFFTSTFFLYKCTTTTRGRPSRPKLNLPPSPPKLPIFGNLLQLGTLPHRSLLALSKKYGPVMLMHLGYSPLLVVTSVDILKEMVKSHDIVFSNRPKTTGSEILLYGSIDVTFAPYGEYWRHAKKVCVHQLLSVQRVQSFQFVRDEEVAVLVETLRCSCRRDDGGGVDSVNLTQMMIDVSNNITSRCVLGTKPDTEEDGTNKIGELSRRVVVNLSSVCYGDFFPSLGWIDVLNGVIPSMKRTIADMDAYFDQVIGERRMLKLSRTQDQDFVDILLQLQSDETLEFVLTDEKMKAILQDMIVAGTEPTAIIMEWTMTELVRNPTILKKAQEEVRRVVGGKSKVDEGDINQMSYLKSVIKEALRLHSPAPLLIPRETSVAIKLGGYDIPPKTRVFVNTWAIQRDPKIWGDNAEEFIPERFETNPIDFKGKDFEFIPFGFGRRGCPGMLFGVSAVESVVANLLYWFDWALPSGTTPENLDMNEVYSISSPKKVPLHVVPALHSP